MGDNTTTARSYPKKLELNYKVNKVFTKYNHNLAITEDNKIIAWGNNWKGQLLISNESKIKAPVLLDNIKDIKQDSGTMGTIGYQNNVGDYFRLATDPLEVQKEIINDEKLPWEWGLDNTGKYIRGKQAVKGIDINVLNVWNKTKGENVVIGLMDSGIDISHVDLKHNIYHNPREIPGNGVDDDSDGYIDDITGWDFLNNNNTLYDNEQEDYHGTLVSGVLAGSGIGKGIVGTSPMAKILPLKFSNDTSEEVESFIEAVDYAKYIGIKIINCSFGYTKIHPEIKEKIDENKDMLFVCAAGNQGLDLSIFPIYPASFKSSNVLTVGAIDCKGDLDSKSNYGPDVVIAAPGTDILTTYPNNKYAFCSGTSYACAYVSGIAALIKSYYPKATTVDLFEAIVSSKVQDARLKDKVITSGRVDAGSAFSYFDKQQEILKKINEAKKSAKDLNLNGKSYTCPGNNFSNEASINMH